MTEAEGVPKELQQAANHLRGGQFELAGVLLARYLNEHPDSADGWVLMSYALEEPERKQECLTRALLLDPEHPKARERMDALAAQFASTREDIAEDEAAQSTTESEPQGTESDEGIALASPEAHEDLASAGEAEQPRVIITPAPAEGEPADPQPEPWTSGSVPPFIESDAPLGEVEGYDVGPVPGEREKRAVPRPDAGGSSRRIWLALAAVCGCGLIAGGLGLAYSLFGQQLSAEQASPTLPSPLASAGPTRELPQASLPASWTPTLTPTVAPTRTPTPTSTITPTPSLVPPNATQQAGMDTIMLEVADLRGLPFSGDVSSYLVPRLKARDLLEQMYRAHGGSEEQIEDRKRELVALGLVKPTYNMLDNILNSMADSLGGFFDPTDEKLFVISGNFGGVERYIYAHEFDHALVDQHFPIDQLGAYPVCQLDQDRCKAISGLVEGDATLVMNQWLEQYAGPQDLIDILAYTPSNFALPEQFPPPFAEIDAQFPYTDGMAFVQVLYDRGNWAEVNAAYAQLPASTEQILHPEKYLAGELPIALEAPPLDSALGDGWRLVARDTLGEWGTYLLLGYSADLSSQVPDAMAAYAAQGWGGDRYQVYYHEGADATALAAHWIWDTQLEADEYHRVLLDHLSSRFRGGTVELGAGNCWEANHQVSCAYLSGAQTLWLLAPDRPLLEAVLGAYGNFP